MKTILNVETNEPIQYSFKKITYRKFRKAIDLLEESRTANNDNQNEMIDVAVQKLIELRTVEVAKQSKLADDAVAILINARMVDKSKQNKMIDEACEILIEGSTALLDGATNADVQDAITAAIEFNQTSEAEPKK